MQPQRSKFHHEQLGEVTLNRSARAKRISIAITRGGEVRLTLPIRGSEKIAMRFLEAKTEWIIAAKRRMAQRGPVEEESSAEEIEQLRRAAKSYLPQRLDSLSRRFNLSYNRVTIRATRTKWGSCSGDNNISLSLFLMKLPVELIDFVLIHELCHTIHHNHSAAFHELVNNCTQGREKELHTALKGHCCR